LVRDPLTFSPFPAIDGVDALQLEQWIQAVRIEAISAMEWKWRESWKVGPRVINDSMWFWFERGSGWGWTGTRSNTFRYRAGDMVLLPQGVEHFVGQDEKAHTHLIAVHFHAHVFGAINMLTMLGSPVQIRASADGFYGISSKLMAREFAIKAPGWRTVMDTEVTSVLLRILRSEAPRFKVNTGGASLSQLPRILPVFECIEKNVGNSELSVADLAKGICLSEVQFRKIFKQITGTNPVCFLQRRRVERACVLLRTTDQSIECIAESCGFSDPPFFHRVFKDWTTMTPSQYRRGRKL
jgi:AraC-like DNA-binding protein